MIPFTELVVESGLSKLNSKMIKYDIGTITAFRSSDTRDVNKAKNRQLLAYLLNKKYSVTKVKGSYIEDLNSDNPIEVGEESFFVSDQNAAGTLKKDLIKLGVHFDQDSILFKSVGDVAKLYGTSDREESYPGKNKVTELGSAKLGRVNGQFFSRVSGRVFAFESVTPIPYPDTINGVRGIAIVSKFLD